MQAQTLGVKFFLKSLEHGFHRNRNLGNPVHVHIWIDARLPRDEEYDEIRRTCIGDCHHARCHLSLSRVRTKKFPYFWKNRWFADFETIADSPRAPLPREPV